MNPLESQLDYPFGDTLPAIGAVHPIASGLWWLRMPLPFALDHINLWLLADGDGTATSLSEHLPVTRQAVAKHLAVLDRVGLVHGAASGRERRYRVDDAQLARAAQQLASVGSQWDGRLRRIARIAERIEKEKGTTAPPAPPKGPS